MVSRRYGPTARLVEPETAPRRVSVLGCTGSIGESTMDLLRRAPEAYQVEALTANSNVEDLAALAREFNAALAVVADESCYDALKEALAGTQTQVAAGADALVEAADRPADWVMAAIVGAAGLRPSLAAAKRGAMVALANKECLVSAGALFMATVKQGGAGLLPVDSEHSAIWQCFEFDRKEAIDQVILTASGGPFREKDKAFMAQATPEQAVAHPNWSMGAKISVDSATMMNKGLELIEAMHLYALQPEKLGVLVHPQSVIHGMVSYQDGSVLAQLGEPDMRTPIAYSLAWPERMAAPVKRLNLADWAQLTFESPDENRFPALRLARDAMAAGGAAPTVLNAANEVAVEMFLTRQIGFLQIAEVVEKTLDQAAKDFGTLEDDLTRSLEAALEADERARAMAARAGKACV